MSITELEFKMGNQMWQQFRSFMTETRVGSVTPLGCIVQVLVTGIATVLVILALIWFSPLGS